MAMTGLPLSLKASMALATSCSLEKLVPCSPWLDHQRLDAIVIPRAFDGPQQIGEDDLAGQLVAVVHLAQQLHRGSVWRALFHQHAGEIEGERPRWGCWAPLSG
jgi:hypothetical protein